MTSIGPSRRPWRILSTALFVGLVVVWLVALRPQFLGGPSGYIIVSGTSMEPALHTGDLVVTKRRGDYRVGEVVAYRIPRGQAGGGRVVIHRIKGGSASRGYVTRGDNRDADDLWRPTPADVLGAQQARVPAAGRVARAILTPVGLGLLAGLAAVVLIAPGPGQPEPSERRRCASPRDGRRRLRWRGGTRRLEHCWGEMVARSAEQQRARPCPDAGDPQSVVGADDGTGRTDDARLAAACLVPAADPQPRVVAAAPLPAQVPVRTKPNPSSVACVQWMMRDLVEAATGIRPRRGGGQRKPQADAHRARIDQLDALRSAVLNEVVPHLQRGVMRARELERRRRSRYR